MSNLFLSIYKVNLQLERFLVYSQIIAEIGFIKLTSIIGMIMTQWPLLTEIY